jgi:NAD+ synthase
VRAERAAALLRIDEGRAIDALTTYVRAARSESHVRSALLGLSGGLDSAVLAAVTVCGLGADRVRLIYLYDQTSSGALRTNARTMADWLGVPLEEASIETDLRKAGVYSSRAAGLTSVSGRLNRLLYRVYRVMTGEPPFVSSLRAGSIGPSCGHPRGGVHGALVLEAEAGFVARHRHRRHVLEAEAAAGDCFLLGAANKTEWLTGWFVKGGIDDLPEQPLKGLYKTQVRQLADALGVPASVRRAPPSPDMMRGITDELALGMSYPTIDVALDVLEGGVTIEQAAGAGVTAEDLRRVQQLTYLSAWKRASPAAASESPSERRSAPRHRRELPVDGGPSGGLRSMTHDGV